MGRWVGGFALLWLSSAAMAGPPDAPAACFDQVQTRAVQAYSLVTLTAKERLAGLRNTCRELSPEHGAYDRYRAQGYPEQAAGLVAAFGTSLMGRALASFSFMRSSETQRSFSEELEPLKSVANRYDRLHGVYDLVSRYQGSYDHFFRGVRTDFTGLLLGALLPGHLVDSAREQGSAGVCRHIAALLYWSLLQVARAPGSTNQALGEGDFSPDFMLARSPDADDVWTIHSWVRVNLPERTPKGLRFHSLDLDSDTYAHEFTLLSPRREHADIAEIDRASAECQATLRCLEKNPAPAIELPSIARSLGRIDVAGEGEAP